MTPLLEVENVSLAYGADRVVRDLSFTIGHGESFGLVGESGSGKSSVANIIIGDLPGIATARGSIRYKGQELLGASQQQLRELRGRHIGFVQQDPGASLNPTMRIGRQLAEALEHGGQPLRVRGERSAEMLARVGFDDPDAIMARYPHQISGGQQQRVMIAMALLPQPDLILLDEPTSGLDVTVEAAVIKLIAELRSQLGTSLLFISHNLNLVAKACDRVGVLYAGDLVEEAPASRIFAAPRHPYTQGLVRCLPGHSAVLQPIRGHVPAPQERGIGCLFGSRCGHHASACDTPVETVALDATHRVRCRRLAAIPAFVSEEGALPAVASAPGPAVITIRALRKSYPTSGGGEFVATDNIDLDIREGEILGLVGESGSGKSTLANIIAGFDTATSGTIIVGDTDIARLPVRKRSAALLRQVQMVFQNPDSTLNPRHTIGWALGRAVRKLGQESRGRGTKNAVRDLLGMVALLPLLGARKPKALSGGQRQRVAIARALAAQPRLLLADECVSALDVSVQAAIIELLQDIRGRTGAAILFISHDLTLVRQISDRIVVLFRGKAMEIGSASQVYALPLHPYTEALLSAGGDAGTVSAAPAAEPTSAAGGGGCPYVRRCGRVVGEVCWTRTPDYQRAASGHDIYCHIPPARLLELQAAGNGGRAVSAAGQSNRR